MMLFNKIDLAIERFVSDKPIDVSDDPKSDWLSFDWRQLTWRGKNRVHYLIEIFPHFNENEEIISWTCYTAAYFDADGKRYSERFSFAKECSLDHIADNIDKLLQDSYDYICKIPKDKIPFAVVLSK